MTDLAFHALAEPRRRAILRLVLEHPRSVGEIAAHFDVTQQAISQHLRVLREAGLVDARPAGQRRMYVFAPAGLDDVHDFLADFWPARLSELKRVVEDDAQA